MDVLNGWYQNLDRDGIYFAVFVEVIHFIVVALCTIYYLVLDRIPAIDKYRIRCKRYFVFDNLARKPLKIGNSRKAPLRHFL